MADSGGRILDYAPASKASPVSRWLRGVPILLSLPAIAVVFLDFVEEVSPWDVVQLGFPLPNSDWQLAVLGAPFFLAFLVFLSGIRRLIWSRLSRIELAIVWLLVGLSASATIYFDGESLFHVYHQDLAGAIPASVSMGIMIAGAALLFFNRRQIPGAEISLLAVYFTYLSHAALCVLGFYTEQNRGPGWYLASLVAALMVLEIIGRLTI